MGGRKVGVEIFLTTGAELAVTYRGENFFPATCRHGTSLSLKRNRYLLAGIVFWWGSKMGENGRFSTFRHFRDDVTGGPLDLGHRASARFEGPTLADKRFYKNISVTPTLGPKKWSWALRHDGFSS